MSMQSVAGWKNKLQGVCGNYEGWHRLEEGIKAILKGAVQYPQFKVDERIMIDKN